LILGGWIGFDILKWSATWKIKMSNEMIKHTVDIVIAYLNKNQMAVRELEILIENVFSVLQGLSRGEELIPRERKPEDQILTPGKISEGGTLKPVVPLADAVTRDEVVCLICGKRGKALKGHLTRSHKMRLDEYRKAFDLPKDFRMVAPSYSEKRRQLAIDAGLGEKLQGGGTKEKKVLVESLGGVPT